MRKLLRFFTPAVWLMQNYEAQTVQQAEIRARQEAYSDHHFEFSYPASAQEGHAIWNRVRGPYHGDLGF